MKHAKPNDSRRVAATRNVAIASAVALGGAFVPMAFMGSASATGLNCSDVGHQVDTSAGDPNGLDADNDGIGCEAYPGPATPLDDAAPAAVNTADTTTPTPDYIVKRGDTLSKIAAMYGLKLAEVEPINPGIIAGDRPDDYSLIFAGGHVHLPAGATLVSPAHPVKTHVWYRSCTEAPAGLHRGQAGYRHALDMDGDGIACEGPWPPAAPVTPPTTPPPVTTPVGTTPVIAPDCPGTSSGYCAHSVTYWAPLIEQAMTLVGGNVAANHNVTGVEALMSAESGGDPNAINNYDSNAANGTPSKGLMQVIQPTFDANHVAGTSENLYDPLANLAAALQYINAQYGGVIPNSPY